MSTQVYEITRKTLANTTTPIGFPIAGKTENLLVHTIDNNNVLGLYGIGETTQGQFGVKNTTKYEFTDIKTLNPLGFTLFLQNISQIAGGDKFHAFVYRDNGVIVQDYVYTWGHNNWYQIGRGGKTAGVNNMPFQSGPGRIDISFTFTGDDLIRHIDSGYRHTHVVTNNNRVFNWGDNLYGQLGRSGAGSGLNDGTVSGIIPAEVTTTWAGSLGGNTVHSVYGGDSHTAILTNQGRVYTIGRNNLNQLGISNGSPSYTATPQLVTTDGSTPLTGVVQIAAGAHFTVALLENGQIWGWGSNVYGQLSATDLSFDGSRTTGYATRIGTLADVVHISAGLNHLVVLRETGEIVVYGDNQYSQRGTFTVNPNAIYVFALRNNTFYVDIAKTLWGVGQGQTLSYLLGTTQATTATPVKITTPTNINVNLSNVYPNYLTRELEIPAPSSGGNVCTLTRYDEDVIHSSSEYLSTVNSMNIVGAVSKKTGVNYCSGNCNLSSQVPFKSYKEKLLFERGLFIRNTYLSD